MEQYSFSGKHVLVTGASGGLGSALVKDLAGMGARLAVSSRSIKPLEELISTLPDATRVKPIMADLSRPGDAKNPARLVASPKKRQGLPTVLTPDETVSLLVASGGPAWAISSPAGGIAGASTSAGRCPWLTSGRSSTRTCCRA